MNPDATSWSQAYVENTVAIVLPVALAVGFYYMANAGGRLTGTVFSGWAYQTHGLEGCLWWSAAFVLVAAALSLALRPVLTGSSPDI